MQPAGNFFLKRKNRRRSGVPSDQETYIERVVEYLCGSDDEDTGAPSSLGVEWATPTRYSDSTSYSESCASDQTAASTIHSWGSGVTYQATFRPRSANEPPVPPNFIRSISCSDEQSSRVSDSGRGQNSARRRRSIDSMLSEYSGYVSVRTISPHPVFDHDSAFELGLSMNDSDLDEWRSSYSPRRRSHHGRSSSANSSAVFVWAGMAHKGRRPSQISSISEYSGGLSDYNGDVPNVSPHYDGSTTTSSCILVRREPSPSFRRYTPAMQRGRRRQSYTATLESQPIPELPFLERRHSFTSSASSGRSIVDFLQQEKEKLGEDDQDWSDEGDAEAESYSGSVARKPAPSRPTSKNPALRILIPPSVNASRATFIDHPTNASGAGDVCKPKSRHHLRSRDTSTRQSTEQAEHQASRRPLRRTLPPELIDHPREYHTSLSYRMIQVEDTPKQRSSKFSLSKIFKSRQR